MRSTHAHTAALHTTRGGSSGRRSTARRCGGRARRGGWRASRGAYVAGRALLVGLSLGPCLCIRVFASRICNKVVQTREAKTRTQRAAAAPAVAALRDAVEGARDAVDGAAAEEPTSPAVVQVRRCRWSDDADRQRCRQPVAARARRAAEEARRRVAPVLRWRLPCARRPCGSRRHSRGGPCAPAGCWCTRSKRGEPACCARTTRSVRRRAAASRPTPSAIASLPARTAFHVASDATCTPRSAAGPARVARAGAAGRARDGGRVGGLRAERGPSCRRAHIAPSIRAPTLAHRPSLTQTRRCRDAGNASRLACDTRYTAPRAAGLSPPARYGLIYFLDFTLFSRARYGFTVRLID